MPSTAKTVARIVLALMLSGLSYWAIENVALATRISTIEKIAVWLSPLSIFGWLTFAMMIALAYLLTGKLPGLRP
jgi:hypothetical protein